MEDWELIDSRLLLELYWGSTTIEKGQRTRQKRILTFRDGLGKTLHQTFLGT